MGAIILDRSQTFVINHDQFVEINVIVNKCLDLELISDFNDYQMILVRYQGSGELNLRWDFKQNINCNLLLLNETENYLNVNEQFYLYENAQVLLNIGDFSLKNIDRNTVINLIESFSSLELNGATLSKGVINWSIKALHRAKNTYANLLNHGVVLKDSALKFDVLGDIGNGYSGSKTYQTTRMMNMDSNVNTQVFPQLVIDENDVEASHAASVGQPDPEAIYYMMSRGISYHDALKQMTLGYLLPAVMVIENAKIRDVLVNQILMKVELI